MTKTELALRARTQVQNAYIDPTSLHQKSKSSCSTTKKSPRVVQSDDSSDVGSFIVFPMFKTFLLNPYQLFTKHEQVSTPSDSKISDDDTGYEGWVEKMGQKQGLLGGSRFKKRWMELKNGTLTWYVVFERTCRSMA